MGTESAFCCGVRFGVKIDRVVGAGLHAGLASDANGRVELDNAIIPLIHSSDGTDTHTRRVDAVITARHLEVAAHIGERSRFNILDPRTVHTKRHLILGFARGGTGVTPDTLSLINKKSVIGHE